MRGVGFFFLGAGVATWVWTVLAILAYNQGLRDAQSPKKEGQDGE